MLTSLKTLEILVINTTGKDWGCSAVLEALILYLCSGKYQEENWSRTPLSPSLISCSQVIKHAIVVLLSVPVVTEIHNSMRSLAQTR